MSSSTKTWTVSDIMRVAVKTVPSGMPLPELENKLLEEKISGFPVVDEGRLVGIVSRSDIVAQICVERDVAERTSDFYFDEKGFHEAPMSSTNAVADRIGERLEQLTVADVMTRHPLTVRFDVTMDALAKRFMDLGVHRLPVVDGDVLVGIVSTSDVVRLIADKRFVAAD